MKKENLEIFMAWVNATAPDTKLINGDTERYSDADVFSALDCALTKEGIIERFIAQYGYYYRYVLNTDTWFSVDFQRENIRGFKEVSKEEVQDALKDVIKSIYREPRITWAAKRAGIIDYIKPGYDEKTRQFSILMNTETNQEKIIHELRNIMSVKNEGWLPKVRLGHGKKIFLETRGVYRGVVENV